MSRLHDRTKLDLESDLTTVCNLDISKMMGEIFDDICWSLKDKADIFVILDIFVVNDLLEAL